MSFPALLDQFPAQHGDNHAQKLWEYLEVQGIGLHEEPVQSISEAVEGSSTSECPTDDVASLGEGIDHGLSQTQVAIDTLSNHEHSPTLQCFQEEGLSSIEEVTPSAAISFSSGDNSVSASLLEDVQLVIHGDCGEVDLSQSGGRKASFRSGRGAPLKIC